LADSWFFGGRFFGSQQRWSGLGVLSMGSQKREKREILPQNDSLRWSLGCAWWREAPWSPRRTCWSSCLRAAPFASWPCSFFSAQGLCFFSGRCFDASEKYYFRLWSPEPEC